MAHRQRRQNYRPRFLGVNHARVTAELATMAQASHLFDTAITPLIVPAFLTLPPTLRQAWWDGLLSSIVGAMTASIGDKATQDSCDDLYERAKDFARDLAKLPTADIPTRL
jgi:hypothetical protein